MRELRFVETDRKTGGATGTRERKIRCPKCRWTPGKHDRWSCLCGHSWNTFDTRGICPACDAAWRETQCLQCHQWSPHDDWYLDEPIAE
ncbi:MAG TPA: hypothetical protein VL326_13865 [Kofleriaceae bacterium]|jgi:hypothetical protein|nr:hypothetical protein [Kofleriaceae bacterium]